VETIQTRVEHPNFETVWAIMQENALQLKEIDRIVKENAERQKETDRQMKEYQREAAERQKEVAERQKETDRQMKEANKRFGDFTNRFGEVIENMVAPDLQEKFKEFGLFFPLVTGHSAVKDYENNIFLEVDFTLHNGDKIMLVEVKTKLTVEDIKEHEKRLEKMRIYADLHGKKNVYLGAVAGAVITPQAKMYALRQGFYVIEPSGETFSIIPPQDKPKEW